MKKLIPLLLAGLLPLALLIGCDDDDDATITGTINGTIIFHGDWPDEGTVQFSLFTNWNNESTGCNWCSQSAGGPPAYFTDASFFQDPDPANVSDADSLTFSLSGITLGTYEVGVAGWRRPIGTGDVECDEPILGMHGADPATGDTVPSSLSFADGSSELSIVVHAYFDRIPDCGPVTSGTISGTVIADNDWPDGGLLAMLTTTPVTGWQPPIFAPAGYFGMDNPGDNTFEFEIGLGDYFVSIWTNTGGPSGSLWYGSYGLNTPAGDIFADMVSISETSPNAENIDVSVNVPAPHFIAGNITFEGDRPAEGLLVMLTTTPAIPPDVPPTAYFPITDETQTQYAFNNIPANTYYVSLWNNSQQNPVYYGSYDPDSNGTPDPVVIDGADNWGAAGIDITGTTP
jgi:hypothetical protein